MEKKTLGSFLSALRKASGLTQRQLADRLHVSDKAVSRWERDESAPDLSLIPAIAEIFGITADELLRGERSAAPADPVKTAEKTEKQIRRILKSTLTTYKIRSCISGAVALVGLIGAMICNFVFLRAYLGFLVNCIFLIAAVLCQSIFLILGRSALDPEEVDPEVTAPARRSMILGAELVFGLIFLLFAASLPLVLLPGSPFLGLTVGSWLSFGGFILLLGIPVVAVPCAVFNLKRGFWHRPNLRSPENRLRLSWLKKATMLLLVMGILHASTASLLAHSCHLLLGGKRFDDWNDFRRYMETPTDADGTPLTFHTIEGTGDDTLYIYLNQDGDTVVFHKPEISQRIYASSEDEAVGGDPLVRYRHLNRQISAVRLNRGGLPIQVFTRIQMQIEKAITILLHGLWCIGYFLAGKRILKKYREEKNHIK